MEGGRLFFYCEHENDHKDQDNDDRGNVHDVFTPPVSSIGTGRIGTSRFPETNAAEEKERTNRLSRWGRDNSLRSTVFTANNSSISYYFRFCNKKVDKRPESICDSVMDRLSCCVKNSKNFQKNQIFALKCRNFCAINACISTVDMVN